MSSRSTIPSLRSSLAFVTCSTSQWSRAKSICWLNYQPGQALSEFFVAKMSDIDMTDGRVDPLTDFDRKATIVLSNYLRELIVADYCLCCDLSSSDVNSFDIPGNKRLCNVATIETGAWKLKLGEPSSENTNEVQESGLFLARQSLHGWY